MSERDTKYQDAMAGAVLKELRDLLPDLLDRQFDAFQKAALPFFTGEDADAEPPWMMAGDCATYRLESLVKDLAQDAAKRFWQKQRSS